MGKKKYPNGDIYQGGQKNGEPNGKGTMRYHAGGVYTGDWKDGVRDGKGEMQYRDGGFYSGENRTGRASLIMTAAHGTKGCSAMERNIWTEKAVPILKAAVTRKAGSWTVS